MENKNIRNYVLHCYRREANTVTVQSNKQLVALACGPAAAVCRLSVSRLVVCVHARLLVPLLQTFYQELTNNMAKNKLTDAEIRKILEQIISENCIEN